MSEQRSLFDRPDADAAARARADGIARASAGASDSWKRCVRWAIRWCAAEFDTFTSDDVLLKLAEADVQPNGAHPAALGPVFLAAARAGEIVKTGELRASALPRRHRDLTVWTRGHRGWA